MAGRARRAGAAVLACLVLAGCATLAADHYATHRSFAEAYRSATVVAIAPSVQVMEHHELQNTPREDWSLRGYENVTRALQAEFEARGLAVVWVEPGPDTAHYLAGVSDAFAGLLPELEKPPFYNIGLAPREFSVGNAGPLLEASGGDLLVVVLASSVALTAEEMDVEYLATLLTLGLHQPEEQTIWVRIAVADWTGRLVCFGMADRGGVSLLNRKAAASAIATALQEIPKR